MMLLMSLVLAGLSVVAWRLYSVQVREAPRLAALASQMYQRRIDLPAHRGTIRDCNDEFLAFDESFMELYTDRRHLAELVPVRLQLAAVKKMKVSELRAQMSEQQILEAYQEHVAQTLESILGQPTADILAGIREKKGGEIIFAKNIELDTAAQWKLVFEAEHIIGVHLRPVVERTFPAKERLALFIGDTDAQTNHGRWGVEKLMDGLLTGTPGEQFIERDRAGRELPAYRGRVIEPHNGHDIHLTIDMQLQDIVEGICEREFQVHQAKRAMIIVTEPSTGSILAAAARQRTEDKGAAWVNQITAGLYEPGSTFKIVTLAAALDQRKVGPAETIDCEDGSWLEPKLNVQINDDESNGRQTVKGVFVHSSNIGVYKIFKRIGRDSLLDYMQRFGFGQRSGIGEGFGEQKGFVNRGDWSNPSYTRIPIGHEVSATPLQVAMAYGAIANGGTLMQARIIDRITGPDGKTENVPPQPIGQACKAGTAAHLRDFAEAVVIEGTGKRAAIENVRVAGKTGTSRRYDPEKKRYIDNHYITSFAGFAPVEQPQVVCVVIIDDPVAANPGDIRGGKVAAPIFAEVVRETLHHLATRHQKRMNLAQEGGQQ